jgi:hypothetical protein
MLHTQSIIFQGKSIHFATSYKQPASEAKASPPFIASRIKKKMMVIVHFTKGPGSFSDSTPPFSWSTASLAASAASEKLIFFVGLDWFS